MKQQPSAWGRPHAPALSRWGRKTLSLFLSVVLCLSMLPATALAEGAESPEHSGHSGWTAIRSATDLTGIQEAGNYCLESDITLSDTWTPANGVKLCLNGHTITGADGKDVITVNSGDTFTLTDCSGNGKITHATMEDGTKFSGRGMTVKGTFEMYGGNITGNIVTDTDNNYGGGVYATGDSTFNMYGGEISDNTVQGVGGGVCVTSSGSTFNLSGGEITGNTARGKDSNGSGGGVAVGNNATFTMTSGTMTENSAMKTGGGVYVNGIGSTFNMTGGRMTDNKANYDNKAEHNDGGGVSVNEGSFNIGGAASISANNRIETLSIGMLPSVSKSYASNVYLTNGGLITVTDTLINELGVVATEPYRVATGTDEHPLTAADLSKFKYDEKYSGVALYLANGDIWLSKGEPHVHPICGATCERSSDPHEDQLWTPISSEEELRDINADGYYYLTDNITLSSTWTPNWTDHGIRLCLNGHSIKCSATDTPTITVNRGASCYLTDCHTGDQVGTITHTEIGTGTGVWVDGGYFNMYGGKITGNYVTNGDMGGGVHLSKSASTSKVYFTMYGGEITGNSTTANGGGVYVAGSADADFSVYYKAKITGNTANGKDNNVYLTNGAIITANSLDDTAEIGVTTATKPDAGSTVKFANFWGSSQQLISRFISDDKQYIPALEGVLSNPVLKLHEHNWQCTTSGATITAKCSICDMDGGSVTIKAPEIPEGASSLVYTSGPNEATLEKSADWQGGDVTITYQVKGNGENAWEALADNKKPIDAGTYRASITLGGVTASVTYEITRATPTTALFDFIAPTLTYQVTEDGEAVNQMEAIKNAVKLKAGLTGKIGTPTVTVKYNKTDVDTATNAGTYEVYVACEAGTGYEALTETYIGAVEIKKAAYTGGSVAINWRYNEVGTKTVSLNPKLPYGLGDARYSIQDIKNENGVLSGNPAMGYGEYNSTVTYTLAGQNQFTENQTAQFSVKVESPNYEDFTILCVITLVDKGDATVNISGMPEIVTYGDTFTLTAEARDADEGTPLTGGTWTWTSTDSNVLAIEGNGSSATVKALKAGAATISVSYESDTMKGTATTGSVTVGKKPLTITAKNQSAYVNGTAPTLGEDSYTVSGLVGNDTLTTNPSVKYVDADGTAITPDMTKTGETLIRASGATASDNYTITYADGKLTVSRRSSSSGSPTYSVTTPDKTENGSVTVSPKNAKQGSTVTITVTPDAGYVLGDLGVTDKSGKTLTLTKKSDTEYTFVMPAGQVEVKASFVKDDGGPSDFADVKDSDYFYDAVRWAVEKGVTNGTDATHFSPDASCTRAQIVTFLWRAAGSPEPKGVSGFADVAEGSYYAKAVAWAVENGITSGTSETTFSPDAACTRAQSVTFLWRAQGQPVSGSSAFTDVPNDSYYAVAVAWAAEKGITTGVGAGKFDPNGTCTRAQIATFLYRTYSIR